MGTDFRDLDGNNARARLYNNGGLFWRGSGNTYTVPINGFANAISATGSTRNTPANRRFLMSSGPFDFAPGDTQVVKLTIGGSQSPRSHRLQAIEQLRIDVDALLDDTPPPSTTLLAPTLVSPPDEAVGVQNNPYYSWTPNPASPLPPAGSTTFYRMEVSTDATFPDSTTSHTSVAGVGTTMHSLPPNERYFWRVRAEILLDVSPWTNTWSFTTGQAEDEEEDNFTDIRAIANANGPLPQDDQGATATWQGFPGLDPTERQQANGQSPFILHTADNGMRASYHDFVSRVTDGGSIGNFGDREIAPYDFEIRFTAQGSRAYDPLFSGCYFDVPFELWRIGIGTPDDPTDDIKLVPYVADSDLTALLGTDNLPAFNLQSERTHAAAVAESGGVFNIPDHTASGGTNDPQSDWIYWTTPDDTTPGTAGYEAWQTHMDANLGLGNCDSNNSFYEVLTKDNALRRVTLFQWNAGDVCNDTDGDGTCEVPGYNGNLPEVGTVFRITTTNPTLLRYEGTFTDVSLPLLTGTEATGSVEASVLGSELTLSGTLTNVTDITQVWLGEGDPGTPGDQLHDLTDALMGNTFDTTLRVEQEGLYAGRYFLQVNTTAFPNGAMRAYLLPANNIAPGTAAIVSPGTGSTLRVEGEEQTPVAIAWNAASDPNGNRLFYRWQLATDEDFNNLLLEKYAGTELSTETSIGALNQLLDAQGVPQEGTLLVYHRVLATDGSLVQASATADVTLSRGVVSASDENEATLPETFALRGNYPNPFNPVTQIAFDLPEAAMVAVQVYDLLGRRVLTLPGQSLGAGSNRTVAVDGSSLASGLYLYRLRATAAQQTWEQTGRMVLLK